MGAKGRGIARRGVRDDFEPGIVRVDADRRVVDRLGILDGPNVPEDLVWTALHTRDPLTMVGPAGTDEELRAREVDGSGYARRTRTRHPSSDPGVAHYIVEQSRQGKAVRLRVRAVDTLGRRTDWTDWTVGIGRLADATREAAKALSDLGEPLRDLGESFSQSASGHSHTISSASSHSHSLHDHSHGWS